MMILLLITVVFVAVVAAVPNPWMSAFPRESIETMKENFVRLANDPKNTRFYDIDDYDPRSSPFKKIVYRQIPLPSKKEILLPVYLHATITNKHLQNDLPRSSIPQEIQDSLRAKDMRVHDEAGHLLAYSLGGGMDNQYNYVPMASCLNRGPYLQTEREIGAFLTNNKNGQVDWHLVVIYEPALRDRQNPTVPVEDLRIYNLRPIGFCLKYFTKSSSSANVPFRIAASKCFHNVLHDSLDAPKN